YGTRQTVACIGSAITEKHIFQVKKLTKQVTLALDPDAAGAAATEHGIQEALKTFDRTVVPVPLAGSPGGRKRNEPRGMIRLEEQVDAEINIVKLPAGEDPDEVIREKFSLWAYAIAHPLPLVEYYFEVKTADLNVREPYGKTEAAKRLLPVIGLISDRIKRDAYMQKLATLISIDERTLYDELHRTLRTAQGSKSGSVVAKFSAPMGQGQRFGDAQQYRQKTKTGSSDSRSDDELDGLEDGEAGEDGGKREQRAHEQQQNAKGLDRRGQDKLQWEDYLIGLLLQNPGLSPHVCGIIKVSDFVGTDTRELYHILNSVYQRGFSSSNQPFEQFVPFELQATVERARKRIELGSLKDGAGLVKEAIQCATRLKRTRLLQLNTELKYLMQEAESTGDSASIQQLRRQLFANQQQLRTIDSATLLQG
ncbi:MAG: hypothetical protein M3Z24_03960, partial [Chloroflexota bacterium]|nr:hypothetical protein [Chloroflexota bacterium]